MTEAQNPVICLCLSLALLLCACAMTLAAGSVPAGDLTPAQIWKDYDPRELAMDVQLVDAWEQDGIRLKKVFLTSEIWKGTPVRVFAIYGYPSGGKRLPAVLHIHGGGGMASLSDVLFWAKRGYAAASLDHMGKLPGRTFFTHWGKVDNTATYGGWGDNPKNDIYYHAVIACMRMITFLERQREVDPNRIGAYGISYGGTFIWQLSALDARLKCVVPIVGCGNPEEAWGEGQTREWHKLYDSSLYAPHQKCPLLMLDASNDFNAPIDNADYTFGRVNTDKRVAYELHYNHYLGPEVSRDLPLWMDSHLRDGPKWPETPQIEVSLGPDGVPAVKVHADDPEAVNAVEAHYNLDEGAAPQARYWRTVLPEREASSRAWTARAPIWKTDQTLRAYCDVKYRSGVVLSSRVIKVVPASLGDAQATLKPQALIDDFAGGDIRAWVWYPCGPNPAAAVEEGPQLNAIPDGPDKGWALGANNSFIKGRMALTTTKISDPVYFAGNHRSLAFRVHGNPGTDLTIIVVRDFWKPGQTEYTAHLQVPAGEDWQRVSLKPGDFKDKQGSVLDGWQNLQQLRIEAQYPEDKPVYIAQVSWGD